MIIFTMDKPLLITYKLKKKKQTWNLKVNHEIYILRFFDNCENIAFKAIKKFIRLLWYGFYLRRRRYINIIILQFKK